MSEKDYQAFKALDWKEIGKRGKRVEGKTIVVPCQWQRGKQFITESHDTYILSAFVGDQYLYIGTFPTVETAMSAAEHPSALKSW